MRADEGKDFIISKGNVIKMRISKECCDMVIEKNDTVVHRNTCDNEENSVSLAVEWLKTELDKEKTKGRIGKLSDYSIDHI